jgi:DNA mismatch repair protein MutL
MGKINILEQDIVSKIAAGEVIERPVSVVKELVENSIDAGSKNIVIEIEEGGKKSIKVIDDGEGMSADDVKLAFKRHATSKIKNVDDIFNIKTLGF